MASGDSFRRKLIKLTGPTLSKKRITLQALNQIHDQIQRYMLVQLFTSTLVGVATWLCFLAIGMEHAAVWGIAAGVLDLVPYVGSVVITTGSMLVSFLQFGTLNMVLLVGGISMLLHILEAFLLTPWLTSRANKMNPFAIFVGVLAWGWLWGCGVCCSVCPFWSLPRPSVTGWTTSNPSVSFWGHKRRQQRCYVRHRTDLLAAQPYSLSISSEQ